MINPYKIRKWAGLVVVGMFTSIFFFVGVLYYGMLVGIFTLFAGLVVGGLVANMLLKNPFSQMLEGSGILAMDINSTGIINLFIVKVAGHKIRGKVNGKVVNDVFDRGAVHSLKVPVLNSGELSKDLSREHKRYAVVSPEELKDEQSIRKRIIRDEIVIDFRLFEETFNRTKFALMQYPVLLYNSQLETFITKDFLADSEKRSFAEHHVLYLNRQMQDLSSSIRDFGRYIVETLKPKSGVFGSKWVMIVVIIVLVILAILFLPAIIDVFRSTGGVVSGASSTAKGVITPVVGG